MHYLFMKGMKTDYSNCLNGQFLFSLAKSFSLVLPTLYAWESSIHLDWLRGDRRCLPVAPGQSKWLTSLGIARWQTAVLLSMLHIVMAMVTVRLVCSLF